MRRRSTFVPDATTDFDPSQIQLDGQNLTFSGLEGAREERFTIGLGESPEDLVELLSSVHELHARWTSETTHVVVSPYLSSVSPGLHVSYTPATVKKSRKADLCDFIKTYFSRKAKCSTSSKAFSRQSLIPESLASHAAYQYYSLLPSLQQFANHPDIKDILLDKHKLGESGSLESATYLDLDYNAIDHALVFTIFWAKAVALPEIRGKSSWSLSINGKSADKNEIGILRQGEATSDSGELQMEGFLAVVGEDSLPKPTMFFIPSRHRQLEAEEAKRQKYAISFDKPTGLHPTMRINFDSAARLREPTNKPVASTCALHAYFTLPSVVFLDEYAFPQDDLDALFTEAHNIRMLRSLSGERDLEAPDYSVMQWGSTALLELETPRSTASEPTWEVTVPMHLRYLKPNGIGTQVADVPWPVVFWACTAEEGTKFSVNPFDRTNVGYDSLFGPRTVFFHLTPGVETGARLIESLNVPVINTDSMSERMIELSTLLLILGGFTFIALQVSRAILGTKGASKKKSQ